MADAYYLKPRESNFYDSGYETLVGPDGFECMLTEPEDRTWGRDGAVVIKELNRLAAENVSMRREILAAGKMENFDWSVLGRLDLLESAEEATQALLHRINRLDKLLEPWDEKSGECWQCHAARRGYQHTNGKCRCTKKWKEFLRGGK